MVKLPVFLLHHSKFIRRKAEYFLIRHLLLDQHQRLQWLQGTLSCLICTRLAPYMLTDEYYRLHQRSARDSLFSNYDAQSRSRPSSANTASPGRPSSRNAQPSTYASTASSPYGGHQSHLNNDSTSHLSAQPPVGGGFSAYPGAAASSTDTIGSSQRRSNDSGFRSATPDKKGRYSDAVLSELESQNDEQVGMMADKVKMLKNVRSDSAITAEGLHCVVVHHARM